MWEYDAQHNSLITLGNGGVKPARAGFTLFYNQGTQRYDLEQTLQTDEQMWVDVGKLIREHTPDKNGKVLPLDLSSGSYEFRDLNDNPSGSLFEGKLIYEKTYGHVVYGCMICCGYSTPSLLYSPFPISLYIGDTNGVDSIDCNDNLVNVSAKSHGGWSTANTAIATVDTNGTHNGVAVGSTSSTAIGSLLMDHGPRCYNTQTSTSGPDNVMMLNCPPSVTRGSNATCSLVNAPTGATFSGWKFTDSNNNTVSGSTTAPSWAGTMVTGGTVSVSVTVSGSTTPFSASIAVNNRTNFAFTAATPSQVMANTLTCYAGDNWVLASPPAAGSYEGAACADQAFSFKYAEITDAGPNNGYGYVTSVSNSSGSSPTKFEYIVVSDLLGATQFYTAQCGTFSSSNTSGFIAGSQLKQNVFDHEQGAVLSHWTEYRDAQNNNSNNIGAVLEPIVGTPGMSGTTYQQNLQNAGNAALSRISAAAHVEPCNGLVTCDSSQVCKTCGAINFAPYQSCGNATPIPYCQ
jgi:hypothetical protein